MSDAHRSGGRPALTVAMLADLIPGVVEVAGDVSATVVDSVTHDSRAVTTGSLFACLRGGHADGHDFAAQAVADGAAALLVDHRLDLGGSTPQIVVDDTRRRLGPLAAVVSGHPSRDMVTIGITGTNGKTTTSLMVSSIFEANGWSTGVIGTLSGPRTTPEAPELQQTLADFVGAGRRAAVLEVSSHALALGRVAGTEFDIVVFTNFGHDHLDLHGTPEEYFRAKASLFTPDFAPLGVVNVDDAHGRLLADAAGTVDGFAVVPYTTSELSDVEVGPSTIAYRWRGRRVDVNIGGAFNVANSLAALVTATELGIEPDVAIAGLRSLRAIPGRFEAVRSGATSPGFSVVVDYAHTPDGLEEVIAAARAVVEASSSVIVVFGCGGDRDQAKRPEMGEVAARLADRIVVTSDNPRTENPESIIDEVLAGVDSNYRERVSSNTDRRAAIGEAIGVARPGDIVVIAGKGHERTQDLGSETIDFDDRVVARSFLEDFS